MVETDKFKRVEDRLRYNRISHLYFNGVYEATFSYRFACSATNLCIGAFYLL